MSEISLCYITRPHLKENKTEEWETRKSCREEPRAEGDRDLPKRREEGGATVSCPVTVPF